MERSKWEEAAEFTEQETLELAGPMRNLLASPDWGAFAEMLKVSRIRAREISNNDAKDFNDVLYWRGYVAGLLAAEEVPKSLVRDAEDIIRQEEKISVGKTPSRRRQSFEDDGDASF